MLYRPSIHKYKFFLFLFQRNHPDAMSKSKDANSTKEQSSVSTFFQQTDATTSKYPASHPRQIIMTKKVVQLVANRMLPLQFVEYDDFRDLMNTADSRFAMPSRKHLSTVLLKKRTETLQDSVKSMLTQSSSVSLTVDIWSSRQMRSYLGVTAHFMHNWKLMSAMLACRRFKGRHTAENIAAHYDEIIKIFDIENSVTYVMSDNASNMMKAFSLPGFEARLFPIDEDVDEDSSEDSDCEVDILQMDDQLSEESDVLQFLPEHDTCFTHTLQLVVRDGLKASTGVRKVISKASSIVAFVHKSTLGTDLLDGLPKLQTATPTRWNSEVKMIRSLLKIPQDKLDNLETVKLTSHDKAVL